MIIRIKIFQDMGAPNRPAKHHTDAFVKISFTFFWLASSRLA